MCHLLKEKCITSKSHSDFNLLYITKWHLEKRDF